MCAAAKGHLWPGTAIGNFGNSGTGAELACRLAGMFNTDRDKGPPRFRGALGYSQCGERAQPAARADC
jgi:hypothetical protein